MTSNQGVSNYSPLISPNNRYILSLKNRVSEDKQLDFLSEDGFRHIETFQFSEENFPEMDGDMLLVELDSSSPEALLKLQNDPRVEFLEADLEFELEDLGTEKEVEEGVSTAPAPDARRRPNDLSNRQWGLDNGSRTDIDAPEAWGRTVGRRDIGPIIAVIDTGVDTDHPDLKANLWTNTGEIPGNGIDDDRNGVIDDVHGFDAYFQDGVPEDGHGHGTHCAGILGATGNNRRGITGVNWQTRIMPIKIFDNDSEKPKTSTSAILRGIAYAGNNGARLTSNSWGGPTRRRSVSRAFSSSRAFHLMGAGNDSQNNDAKPFYPASYRTSNSLSVAAVDRRGNLSDFSNYGKTSVDLAAPGTGIYSTVPGGRYRSKSGTSMATPFVTGVAGLLLSLAPSMSNSQIRSFLLRGVEPLSALQDTTVTGGVVNAHNSVELLFRSGA